MDKEEKQEEQQGQEQPISRIVIEFVGPGMADVKTARFDNVSLGQMLSFARYAEWQAANAVQRFEEIQRERRRAVAVPKLVIPQGRVQ